MALANDIAYGALGILTIDGLNDLHPQQEFSRADWFQ